MGGRKNKTRGSCKSISQVADRGVFPTKNAMTKDSWSEIVGPSMLWWDDVTDRRDTPQVAGKTPQLR